MRLPFFNRHLEKKESRAGGAIWLQWMGQPTWTPRDYAHLSEEAYQKNAIAYRCIRLVAEGAALVPWMVHDRGNAVFDHPLLSLIRQPNPLQGGVEFLEAFYSFYLAAGNAYLEAVLLDGELRELWNLRPDRIRVRLNQRGFPSVYEYTVSGKTVSYEMSFLRGVQQPVLHLKAFHPTNDVYGLSPVEPAAYSIDIHSAAGKFNKALLDNQARPSGALVYKNETEKNLTDEQFSRLKTELNDAYAGTANAGRPLVLDGGLEWQDMSVTPKDLDFVEGKRESAREIALSFGVPPMLLGIPGDNTYSNYVEANRAFYRQTVLPLVGRACSAFTGFFRPTFGPNIELWYDTDEVPALVIEREALWKKIATANWLTIDEKREATGYPKYVPTKEPGGELSPSSADFRGDRGRDDGDRKPAEQP